MWNMKRALFFIVLFLAAASAFGHCDTFNGPVVTAARQALQKRDVTPVLKWVSADSEAQIREAFAKTLAAREASPQAREIADQWFFETVVRLHRTTEGEPFTGITNEKPEAGIELADEAIETGSLAGVEKELTAALHGVLQARFAHLLETKKHSGESVAAGREFVHAYVEFIHLVETLHGNLSSAPVPRTRPR